MINDKQLWICWTVLQIHKSQQYNSLSFYNEVINTYFITVNRNKKRICNFGTGSSASSTGAIAGGVAAGAALLIAVPAIAFAWCRRRKPEEYFFDVPG